MSLLRDRWSSGDLTGDSRQVVIVRLRPGFMKRGYLSTSRIDDNSPIFPPLLWKGQNIDCWKGEWNPTGPWLELPNVVSAKWSRGFDPTTGGQQGTGTIEVVMDNIAFVQETGAGGLYHAIERGFYSPTRGLTSVQRPNLWPQDTANAWQDVLNAGYQIEVWEGYGTGADVQLKTTLDTNHSYAPDSGALDRTATGIVTSCETESHPDKITVTAQDFGIVLTDQRLMGKNKAPEVPSPVTFGDRKRTQGQTNITGPYQSSTGTVDSGTGAWQSNVSTNPSYTPWLEIDLPAGYYTNFFLAVPADETFSLSLFVGPGGGMAGVHAISAGWLTLPTGGGGGESGGTINGTPYLYQAAASGSLARQYLIAPPAARADWQGYSVPAGSKLRLTFSNLPNNNGVYFAAVDQFMAYQYGPATPAATTASTGGVSLTGQTVNNNSGLPPGGASSATNYKGWVLVQDASEVVRMILIWAGFQEWHVEEFGWSLFQPRSYGADKFYIDVINDMLAQGAYIFFMGAPTNDDRSIGVPHFEHMAALDPPKAGTIEVTDQDVAESLQVTWDLSNLPHAIRYRGALSPKGMPVLGMGISGLAKRFTATYYAPWSGFANPGQRDAALSIYAADYQLRRDAGTQRYFTETMGDNFTAQLQSNQECLFACILAAINYALVMAVAQFQMPGLSRINLNNQMAVVEEASAINSRIWVQQVDSEHVTGGGEQPGYWRVTVTGSLIDTLEMDSLKRDYNYAWKINQQFKAALASA